MLKCFFLSFICKRAMTIQRVSEKSLSALSGLQSWQ